MKRLEKNSILNNIEYRYTVTVIDFKRRFLISIIYTQSTYYFSIQFVILE